MLIDPSHSAQARRALRDLVPNGQRRIHFNGEKDGTRRRILSQVARIPFDWRVYVTEGAKQTESRERLLLHIAEDLVVAKASLMVLESRHGQDEADRRLLYGRLGPAPRLQYAHAEAATEPLLWLPDCLTRAWGRGGDYRKLLESLGISPQVVDVE
ncbi:MAG TPA: hypothetical protein ENI86_18540 [Acidimicrobiales bacterium]|nr:hypothetical protein [Acidimicrobiales bacterium]